MSSLPDRTAQYVFGRCKIARDSRDNGPSWPYRDYPAGDLR
jgi:hypothetical protein